MSRFQENFSYLLEAKEINVKYIATAEKLADSITKPLPNLRFSHLREAIGIVSVPEI
jgi:hypothetical protein